MFDDLVNENMPPIRGSNCSVPLNQVKKCLNNVPNMYIYVYKKYTKIKSDVTTTDFRSKRKEEFFKTPT